MAIAQAVSGFTSSLFGPFLNPLSEKIFGPSYFERAVRSWGDSAVGLAFETKRDAIDIIQNSTDNVIATVDKHTGELTKHLIDGSERAIDELEKTLQAARSDLSHTLHIVTGLLIALVCHYLGHSAPCKSLTTLTWWVAAASVAAHSWIHFQRHNIQTPKRQQRNVPRNDAQPKEDDPPPEPELPNNPDDYRVLDYVENADGSLSLDLLSTNWKMIRDLAEVLSELQSWSNTIGILGRTGVGKSYFMSNIMGPEDVKPRSRDPDILTEAGQTSGVSIFPTRLGFTENMIFLDPEGEGGRGVAADARMATNNISFLSGKTSQILKAVRNVLPDTEAQKRLTALQYDIPKFVYLMSDLLIVIGQLPLHDDFYKTQAAFLRGIGSGDRFAKPALLLIRNKAPKGEYIDEKGVVRSIDETTAWYQKDRLTDEDLQYYSSVHFVLLPDLYDMRYGDKAQGLLDQRIQETRELIRNSLKTQQLQRKKQGTLFNMNVWCRIVERAVSCYQKLTNFSIRGILSKIQLEMMSDREQILTNFVDAATFRDNPDNDKDGNITYYNDGVRSNVAPALSAVLASLNPLEGMHDPMEAATDIAYESYKIAAERLKGNTPCTHLYNGKRYKQDNEDIVCCEVRRNHGETHRSPRLLFGGKPDDGFWAQIGEGISYTLTKFIVQVGGREACWSDKGDEASSATYSPSSYITAVEDERTMRGSVNSMCLKLFANDSKTHAPPSKLVMRARGIVLMSSSIKHIEARFKGFSFCLGCGVKLNPSGSDDIKTFKNCEHSICGDCSDCLSKQPTVKFGDVTYTLRSCACPFH